LKRRELYKLRFFNALNYYIQPVMLTMAPKDINRSVLQFEPCQCNLVEVCNCFRTIDCFKIWM